MFIENIAIFDIFRYNGFVKKIALLFSLFFVLVIGQIFAPTVFAAPVSDNNAASSNSSQTENIKKIFEGEPVDNNVIEEDLGEQEQAQAPSQRNLLILSLDHFIELLGNFDSYDCFAPFADNGKFKLSFVPEESTSFNDVKTAADSLSVKVAAVVESENSQEKLSINLLRFDDEISNQMNELYNLILAMNG